MAKMMKRSSKMNKRLNSRERKEERITKEIINSTHLLFFFSFLCRQVKKCSAKYLVLNCQSIDRGRNGKS